MAGNRLVLPFLVIFSEIVICLSRNRLTKHFPADPEVVHLVGIYGEDEENDKLAFESAVEDINKDSNILKRTLLQARTETVNLKNSFTIKEKLCSNMKYESGVTAVFGGSSEEGIPIIQSVTDFFKIPYLFSTSNALMYKDGYSVNVFPQMETLTKGVRDIVHDMDWTSFTLLYENEEDLILFQELLVSHDELKDEDNFGDIVLKRLPSEDDYGPLLKEVRNSSETRILLGCSSEKILPILRKARSLNLMGDYYAYVLVSLDTHIIDFREFIQTHTNITVLSLIDPNIYIELEINSEQNRGSTFLNHNTNKVKSQALLTYDSVRLFAKALDAFLESGELKEVSLDCDAEMPETFESGPSLVNFIKATEINEMTSPCKIDDYGKRSSYTLQIIQVSPKNRNKLGTWDPEGGINYARNVTQINLDAVEFMANKTFIVSSKLEPPYLMKCADDNPAKTEDEENCYEGFSKDIIELIAKDVKFSYKIVLSPDGNIGTLDPMTGKWNGIIKEVQERRADLGICDLTITSDRRKVVDFTKPFMSLGISILHRKREEEESHMFSFLSPLEFQVWLCVATSLLGTSIVLFIVSRFTPYDWESSHPCDPNTGELENALSLVNCLWFSLGSVLQQGCDILPNRFLQCIYKVVGLYRPIRMLDKSVETFDSLRSVAISSRIVAAMWWFFTLIMASTYTANLAAFLTSKQMESEIKDVNALAAQNIVKYGCKPDGSTGAFFKNSNDNLYQKMWATMESTKPSVFAKDNNDGKNRVLRDKNYAFFMESSTIEYLVERHCELTQVGGLLDNKGYGIAMPLNSPYRTIITTALLKQQENGNLKELKKKWWINHDESKKCSKRNKDSEEENALDVSNVGGVFVVLLIGMASAFILSLLEFLWNIRKVAVVEKIPLSTAFRKELHFVLNCHISTKPVRKSADKLSESNGPTDRYEAFLALGNTK